MDWAKLELAMTDPSYLHRAAVFRDEPRMAVEAVQDNLDDGLTAGANDGTPQKPVFYAPVAIRKLI